MKKFSEIVVQLIAKQTLCDDEAQVEELIDNILTQQQGTQILSFVNAHAVMRSTREVDFFNDLMESRWLLRDGAGLAMIMRRVGQKPGMNLNGTDFIPRLLQQIPRNWKLALVGTKDPYLNLAAERLRAGGFENISTLDGFLPEKMYVEHMLREEPDVIILAMGMPKQERVARCLAHAIHTETRDMLIVNGGAILDFISGEVPRAPTWMRSCGIEWLYRLLREPRRMFPRFIDSLAFAVSTLLYGRAIRYRLSIQTKRKTP